MQVSEIGQSGLQLVRPQRFQDDRGWFTETFNALSFRAAGLPVSFVQDNSSFSRHGVLRGLHRQRRNPQGKLIRVLSGHIWDVAVDLRRALPTFGQWTGVPLQAATEVAAMELLWIPEGFAHGFLVLSDSAEIAYKVTRPYDPADEETLLWNDPDLAIDWPLERISGQRPLLSAKDAAGVRLAELTQYELA